MIIATFAIKNNPLTGRLILHRRYTLRPPLLSLIVINHKRYYMAKNYMTRHNTNHTGFTIVELLIVIVIISILAVVAILTFGTIRERATVSSIETGASAYMRAIQTYRAEHEHFPLEKEQVVYAYGNVSVYGFCVGAKESYPNPTKGCGGWTLNNKPTDINKYKPTDGFHREILKTIVNQSSPRFDCFYTASNGSCARGYVFLPSNIPSGSSRLNGQTRAFFWLFPARKAVVSTTGRAC